MFPNSSSARSQLTVSGVTPFPNRSKAVAVSFTVPSSATTTSAGVTSIRSMMPGVILPVSSVVTSSPSYETTNVTNFSVPLVTAVPAVNSPSAFI